MKKIVSLLALISVIIHSYAADLIRVVPITNKILMIELKEGHMDYMGVGQDRYKDGIIFYGSELNITNAGSLDNYTITSKNDTAYKLEKKPILIKRKAKATDINNMYESPEPTHWKTHWVYITIPTELVSGKTYTIKLNNLADNTNEYTFNFDEKKIFSETIKVNQIGYRPGSPKYAYLSQWMGDGGSLELNNWIKGKQFHIVKNADNSVVFTGSISMRSESTSVESIRSGWPGGNNDFSHADVAECNFTAFNDSGIYKIVVDGMGCSYPFEIKNNVFAEPYYWASRALFLQRAGVHKEIETNWEYPRDYHPDDSIAKFFYDPNWKAWTLSSGGHVGDKSTFDFTSKPISHSGMNAIFGWYHDAGDWDGYQRHIFVPYSLLLLYDLKPENFKDGDVNNRYKYSKLESDWINEGSNGIPDILDEAAWLIKALRRAKDVLQANSYGTGGVPDYIGINGCGSNTFYSWTDTRKLAVTAQSPAATYGYASAAAYYAYHLKNLGKTTEGSDWEKEAKEAYTWAKNYTYSPSTDYNSTVKKNRLTAAAVLYKLTGTASYQTDFSDLCTSLEYPGKWSGGWMTLNSDELGIYVYALLPSNHPGINTTLRNNIRDKIVSKTRTDYVDYAKTNRKFRVPFDKNKNWFSGTFSTPITYSFAVAYAIDGGQDFADAIQYSADYAMGTNELNMVWMIGVGDNPDKNVFHTNLRIMTDRNSKVYGTTFYPGFITYGGQIPAKMTDYSWVGDEGFSWSTCYPDANTKWPAGELRIQNIHSVSESSEFTVNQNLAPAIFTYGYLAEKANLKPNIQPSGSLNLNENEKIKFDTIVKLTVNATPDTRRVSYFYEHQYIGESTLADSNFVFMWDITKYKVTAGKSYLITAVFYDDYGRMSDPSDNADKKISIVSKLDEDPNEVVGNSFEPEQIKLYSNPINSKESNFFLTGLNPKNKYEITLVNQNGNLVYLTKSMNSENKNINVSSIQPGFYFLTVYSEYFKKSFKVFAY